MPKFLIVIWLLLLLNIAGNASPVKAKPVVKHIVHHTLRLDTSKLKLRSFNNDALQQYLKDKHFQYDENGTLSHDYWSDFWSWLWRLIDNIFDHAFVGKGTFFPYLLLTITAGFIAYVIFKVLGIDVLQVFRGQAKKVEIPYAESLENIHEISFDDEIEKAVTQRNYKLAVRLLYLRSLKQLSDAQLIHWQIEKTNSAYINELSNPGQRQSFSVLTRQFEYIWYGDFFVDGTSFQNINTLFQDFKQLLR